MQQILCLEKHSPFTEIANLVSIANGITATKESQIDSDEVEKIGSSIDQSLKNIGFATSKIKQSEKVKMLANL